MQRQITEIIRKAPYTGRKLHTMDLPGLTGLLSRKFDGFNFGISIGRKLDDAIADNISDGPAITNN